MTSLLLIAALVVGAVLVLLSLLGVVFGLAAGALWWAAAIHHAFKAPEPPSTSDADWDRDQGREAG